MSLQVFTVFLYMSIILIVVEVVALILEVVKRKRKREIIELSVAILISVLILAISDICYGFMKYDSQPPYVIPNAFSYEKVITQFVIPIMDIGLFDIYSVYLFVIIFEFIKRYKAEKRGE